MRRLVVDASVVLGWTIAKNEADQTALELLQQGAVERRLELHAPTFLLIEIINVLSLKYHIRAPDVQSFADHLRKIGVRFTTFYEEDMSTILQLVTKHGITSYDAHYVLLAQRLHCDLVTSDRKLLRIEGVISLKDLEKETTGAQ